MDTALIFTIHVRPMRNAEQDTDGNDNGGCGNSSNEAFVGSLGDKKADSGDSGDGEESRPTGSTIGIHPGYRRCAVEHKGQGEKDSQLPPSKSGETEHCSISQEQE